MCLAALAGFVGGGILRPNFLPSLDSGSERSDVEAAPGAPAPITKLPRPPDRAPRKAQPTSPPTPSIEHAPPAARVHASLEPPRKRSGSGRRPEDASKLEAWIAGHAATMRDCATATSHGSAVLGLYVNADGTVRKAYLMAREGIPAEVERCILAHARSLEVPVKAQDHLLVKLTL